MIKWINWVCKGKNEIFNAQFPFRMFLILELSRLIIYSNPEATKCYFFASDARYYKLHMSTKTDTERTHPIKNDSREIRNKGSWYAYRHIYNHFCRWHISKYVASLTFILKEVKNNVFHLNLLLIYNSNAISNVIIS